MKPKLIVDKNCPNCNYLIEQLNRSNLLDKVEVVEKEKLKNSSIKAVPCILIDNKIDYLTGNIYGFIKLLMYIKKGGET